MHRFLQQHPLNTGANTLHPSLWYPSYMSSTNDALLALQKRTMIEMNKSV